MLLRHVNTCENIYVKICSIIAFRRLLESPTKALRSFGHLSLLRLWIKRQFFPKLDEKYLRFKNTNQYRLGIVLLPRDVCFLKFTARVHQPFDCRCATSENHLQASSEFGSSCLKSCKQTLPSSQMKKLQEKSNVDSWYGGNGKTKATSMCWRWNAASSRKILRRVFPTELLHSFSA